MTGKKRVVILLRQLHDERSSKNARGRAGAMAYAEARAHSGVEVETLTVNAALLGTGGEPHEVFDSLQPGSVIVIPNFAHLSDGPNAARNLRLGIPKLIGRGLRLHIAELGGDVARHLDTLTTAWEHAEPLEAALEAERAAGKKQADEWDGLFRQYQKDLTQRLMSKYGFPASGISREDMALPEEVEQALYGRKAPANGQDEAPADLRPLGEYVRKLREGHSWTQPMLGEHLGVSASQISRLESTGEGPHVLCAIAALGDHDETWAAMSPSGRAQLAKIKLGEMAADRAGAPVWLGPDGSQGGHQGATPAQGG